MALDSITDQGEQEKSEKDIVVYGHTRKEFPSKEDFISFIREGIFARQDGRYRYSQTKNADIIVLSWKGNAFGHFDIAGTEEPTENDEKWLKKAKKTYLAGESYLYKRPVKLSQFKIKGFQFGKRIKLSKFDGLLAEVERTGGLEKCDGTPPIAGNSLRTEDLTHGQGEFHIPDKEGRERYAFHIRYERSRKNRAEAIRIHGAKCKCCELDFNTLYGKELARDYIEVHHNRSITSLEGVSDFDIAKDLVPLCSNCHSMVHRRNDEIISVEELRAIMEQNRRV